MERLTIPDKKIDGGLRRAIIDAREVRKEAMTIYWALKKYEDTGLDPEQIVELKERDTAKIVNLIPFDGCDDDSDITYKAYCPICKRYIGILFKKGYKGKGDNFCRNCGQRLKWED